MYPLPHHQKIEPERGPEVRQALLRNVPQQVLYYLLFRHLRLWRHVIMYSLHGYKDFIEQFFLHYTSNLFCRHHHATH